MADKVIFEFRANQGKEGPHFDYVHDKNVWMACAPLGAAHCRPNGKPGKTDTGGTRLVEHQHSRTRRSMREALDFFEELYDDLYNKD